MEIVRAKTIDLLRTQDVLSSQQKNAEQNQKEARERKPAVSSFPQRLVLELTNQCNMKCRTCGRNAADFKPSYFDIQWLSLFEPLVSYTEEVTLMGWGEPTIHPDFPLFLKWAYEKKLRKYFCTNGMLLDQLFHDIFQYHVDIIAVSLDGKDQETNDAIRLGGDLEHVKKSVKRITGFREENGLSYPYMNIVFTAMKKNIQQLPDMIDMAAELGMDEVKVVYFTAMEEGMKDQILWNEREKVEAIFDQAKKRAEERKIRLKLPYLQGEDLAGDQPHKPCYCAWRDFFLGSDGFIRPCMSSDIKLGNMKGSSFDELWNSERFQSFRSMVNETGKMLPSCRNCYQSSFANWNLPHSFLQVGKHFAPEWEMG